MLMIYWGKVCTIYDAMAGRCGNFEDGQLNRLYLLLVIRVDKILAKDGFEEQRQAKPQLYDTFMGNLEDSGMAYEFMRPELWNYYGTLERQFVEKADGVGTFELTDEELFKTSNDRLRQKLLEYVLSNIELNDKKLSYTFNELFKTIVETKKMALAGQNSNIWCPRRTLFRTPSGVVEPPCGILFK